MEKAAAPEEALRRRPARILASGAAKFVVGFALGLLLLAGAFLALIDTGPGHRFLVDRIAALAPDSGLRIRIGRIDGSIWGETILRDVRLYDPEGLFAEAPEIQLDWRPLPLLADRLLIHELKSDLVILHRLPEFEESDEPGPVLPDLDVHIGRLAVAQVRIGEAVTGEERSASLAGEADIRKGRALVELRAEAEGGDRLRLVLDAEPDRDRFDLEARLDAPARGVLGAMLGTRRPVRLVATGEGGWSDWDGTALLNVSGRRAADLALAVNSGRLRVRGWTAPAPFLTGRLQRLSAPRIAVDARGTFADRTFDGRASLRSAALRLEARGAVDLGDNAYEDVAIAAELLRPEALFRNMAGRQVRGALLLDGRFGRADFAYRLAAPRVAFDETGFEEVRIEGRGTLSRPPVPVPVLATAARVTGVDDTTAAILRDLRVAGMLRITPERATGEALALASAELDGRLSLAVDLRDGDYLVTADATMDDYAVPGLGLVDVETALRAVPGPGRRGTIVEGTARAEIGRLDNRFLEWLGGGRPRLETRFTRGTDKILRFSDLRVAAPELRLALEGLRRRDGTYALTGAGEHGEFGPLRLDLDGRLERPRLAVRLERPVEALGLTDTVLNLDPTAAGFAWNARGGSLLGPFAGAGAVLLPRGAPAVVDVDALRVSGTTAEGALRLNEGGFSGRLDVAGGGLEGRLLFHPLGPHQRIGVELAAHDASFAGPPAIEIRRGSLEGVVVLDPAGTSIEAELAARGLRRGGLSIASVDAAASLRGGTGTVRADLAGSRGRDFEFAARAEVAPGRVRLTGQGTLDRRPVSLARPAVLTRTGEGWRLSPTALRFAGGSAEVSGLFGERVEFDAGMEAMPLTVLDIAWPRLGLGGLASGRLEYRAPAGGGLPSGEANLRVRGLTRSGLVLSSRPVDIGLNARLTGANAAARAVAASEGRTVGRAQARVTGMAGGGTVFDRLTRSPLQAQVRYNGPADTLWRLTGVELLDLSGPAAIAADVRGTMENPAIDGSVRTAGARLESAVTGMVVEGIEAAGRFDGSRLRIARFSGRTEGGGTVFGSGSLDLGARRGVGIDFAVEADEARLLDRDDIRAAVTGPLRIRSDGEGGVISGALRLASGRFRLGSATNAAQVRQLPVREVNRPGDDLGPVVRRISPWRLDLEVDADDRLTVTGLGMSSEWKTDLAIAGTVTEPRITGDAELLRGTYDFAGRRFDLVRGDIRFAGESPVNPAIDIAAEARVRGLNAQIRVTGRSQRPEIAFASTPALPQDELLSRILFGTSITSLSAPEAVQLAAAVASLNDPGGGLDPINAIRRTVGLDRLRILPADATQGIGTQLAAGKYLGRRVYVEVVTDAQGYSATIVEYQLTRWLSILSSISTIGRESVNVRVSRDY